MDIAKLILEYMKAFLSTQVVIGVAFLYFLNIFREDIKALLLRIAKIRFPGGTEISTSQAGTQGKDVGESAKLPTPSGEEIILPNTLKPEQTQELKELFLAERARAYLWEYSYLNYFFVLKTQRVLDWFASLLSRASVDLYDSVWLLYIPSAEERRNIIEALQAHHLISIQNNLIEVTPKGKEYINWRGPLPEYKA